MAKTAALFWNGRSQAVRLPKEYRFDAEKVLIERKGDCIILKPYEKKWTEEFWQIFGTLPEDFERPPVTEQKRERLFK